MTEFIINGTTYDTDDFINYDFFAPQPDGDYAGEYRWLACYFDFIAAATNGRNTTSVSSIALATGVKTIVLVDPLYVVAGMRGVAIDTADSANKFYFEVDSYNAETKTITTVSVPVSAIEGSGTKVSWNIVLGIGQKGDTGPTGTELSDDASPELAGNLDVLNYTITSSSLGYISIDRPILGQRFIVAWTTTTKTLGFGDAGTVIAGSNASTQTLTIPANATTALPTLIELPVVRYGSGRLIIQAATGVTLNGVLNGSVEISAQHKSAVLIQTGADTWSAVGSVF